MTTETKRTCDRCGNVEWGDATFLETVMVCVGQFSYSGPRREHARRYAEWCKPCRVTMGIENQKHAPDVVPIDPTPTLEDLIREICAEVVEQTSSG